MLEQVVLQTRGVDFAYASGQPVLRGVDCVLRPGRLTAMLGPNAAGKSTLMRVLLGQLRPQAGQVTLAGQPMASFPPRQRARRLSYVPQRGAVSFSFTVEQIVGMGRFALGASRSAVQQALEMCELQELRGRVFAHLSGGQQQRVLLARALAQSAGDLPPHERAMLLDEPGSSMDLRHVHQMMGLLRRQTATGLAVLVVLHDLNLAARYADDVWLLDAGRVRSAGPWQEVMRPTLLEPVYRVSLTPLHEAGEDRPVFLSRPMDTLEMDADPRLPRNERQP